MSAEQTKQVLTAEEQALVIERSWSEALVEEQARVTERARFEASFANWEARQAEWRLANEKALADPMQRLITYECIEARKRLRKSKRLAA